MMSTTKMNSVFASKAMAFTKKFSKVSGGRCRPRMAPIKEVDENPLPEVDWTSIWRPDTRAALWLHQLELFRDCPRNREYGPPKPMRVGSARWGAARGVAPCGPQESFWETVKTRKPAVQRLAEGLAPMPSEPEWSELASDREARIRAMERANRRRLERRLRGGRPKVVAHEWEVAPSERPWVVCSHPARVRALERQDERRRAVYRAIQAQKQRAIAKSRREIPWIRIAGQKCPKIGLSWMPYMRKATESTTQWRARVKSLAAATWLAKRLRKHERNVETLHVWDQILLISRGAGLYLPNIYENLEVDSLDVLEEGDCNSNLQPPKRLVGLRSAHKVRFGPKTCWGYEWRERNLSRKKKLHALQEEWREARFLRKEKMSRVLLRQAAHRVQSLRSALEQAAMESLYSQKKSQQQPIARAEMEAEQARPQGDASASSDKKSNVEVQQQEGASVGSSLPAAAKRSAYSVLSASGSQVCDETFHDRWFTIWSGTWTGTQVFNSKILELNIPKDIFNHKNFRRSPNYAILSRHAYWKGDIEFKIITNTNVRQYGQLQFSFYYGSIQDKNYDLLREDVFVASQRLHSLMTANFSNEVIIKVPFEYIFPLMAINVVDDKNFDIKHIGKLLGMVIVPLTAVAECPNSASLKVLVRFTDNTVSGMIGTAIAEAQMMPALATIVAVKSLLDKNRDRPTFTTPGMPVIPVNAASWCVGSGQPDYHNILRLNPNKVLEYADGRIPPVDEMTVDYLKKTFGMLQIVNWSKSSTVGELLFKWDAAPISSMRNYHRMNIQGRNCSVVPPVGVLSSLFAYWRGSLELRVDIVGATEISGSLLCCYVPRHDLNSPMTMEDAFTCAHSIHSIHENRQIVFQIPFVAAHMFWPRRNTLSTAYPQWKAPGCIYVFCYNQLVVNCAIPDNVELVFYLRAGPDFEVAVPACPSFGLSFNTQIFIPSTAERRFVPVEGYSPVYVSTWHSLVLNNLNSKIDARDWVDFLNVVDKEKQYTFKNDVNYWLPILRYGAVSDHVTQFHVSDPTPPSPGTYNWPLAWLGKMGPMTNSKFKMVLNSSTLSTMDEAATHIMCFEWGGYYYGLPVTQPMVDKLSFYFDQAFTNQRPFYGGINELIWPLLWFVSLTQAYDNNWNSAYINSVSSEWWQPATLFAAIVKPDPPAQAQADEKDETIAPLATPQDTAKSGAASIVFGEQFIDLKDYCRRYQLYASRKVNMTRVNTSVRWRTITLRFPVMPQGLELDLGDPKSPNEYWNRTREGPIPLIASGFRFFTGGIRFRICVNIVKAGGDEVKGKIFVQHRPNVATKLRSASLQTGVSLGTDDLELPGYAAYHQIDEMNSVISVEIPFYQPTIRTYLQEPSYTGNSLLFTGLGELAIGFSLNTNAEVTFSYDIYYCLADDARFSVFVGFPPVYDITKIPQIIYSSSRLATATDEAEKAASDTPIVPGEKEPSIYEVAMGMVKALKDCTVWNKNDTRHYQRYILQDKWDELVAYLKKRLEQVECATAEMGLISKLKDTVENASASSSKVDKLLDKIDDQTIDDAKGLISTLKSFTSNFTFENLTDKIKYGADFAQEKLSKYVDMIISAITNLVHALLNFNLRTVCWAITSFFVQCKAFTLDYGAKFLGVLRRLLNWLTSWRRVPSTSDVEPLPEHVDEVANAEMGLHDENQEMKEDDQCLAAYVSSLVAGVGAAFMLVPKMRKATMDSIGEILLNGITKFTFCANHLFTFIKNNLLAVKRIYKYFINDHPSMRKLGVIRDRSLHDWAREVLEITDPRKDTEVFTSARMASKAYSLAAQANLLQITLLELKLDAQEVKLLDSLIKKIHDLRDRLAKAHLAPPVRFEPFVYELTGRTGVGKSELLKKIPYKLFKAMGLTHEGELIYHRALGNAYWNNLKNQPVCTIDEKFPVGAPGFLDVQLAELFQLKSSAVFNPPMADIPDKNIRYNPLIVQYASNCPFPTLPNVLDIQAIDRRRDALIEVAMTAPLLTKYGEGCKYSMLNRHERVDGGVGNNCPFGYLRFRFHHDVTVRDVSHGAWGDWMNFEQFIKKLSDDFSNFFYAEERKFRADIALMTTILPKKDEISSVDNILQYQWLDRVEEVLAKQENKFIEKIKEKYYDSYKFSDKMHLVNRKMQLGFYEITNYEGRYDDKIKELTNELYDMKIKHVLDPKREELVKSENTMDNFKESNSKKIVSTINKAIKLSELRQKQVEQNLTKQVEEEIFKNIEAHAEMVEDLPKYRFSDQVGCIHCILQTSLACSTTTFNKISENWEVGLTASSCYGPSVNIKEVGSGQLKFVQDEVEGVVEAIRFEMMNKRFGTPIVLDCKNFDIPTAILGSKPCSKFKPCPMADYNNKKTFITDWWINSNCAAKAKFNNCEYEDILPKDIINKNYNKKLVDSINEHEELKTKFVKFKDYIRGIKEKFMKVEWKKWLKRLGILVSIFSFIAVAVGLFRWSQNSDTADLTETALIASIGASAGVTGLKPDGNAEGHVSGDYKVAKSHRAASKPAVKMLESAMGKAEAGFGIKNEQAMQQHLKRNSFFLALHNDKITNPGRCLGICGNYALIVDHFYEAWMNLYKNQGLADMTFISCRDGSVSAIMLSFTEVKYQRISDSNLGIITLPKRIPPFRDIRKFFAPSHLHSKLNMKGQIYELQLQNSLDCSVDLNIYHTTFKNYHNLRVSDGKLWKGFKVHEGYHYPAFYGQGKCGSVLLGHDIEAPIIGVHIAGFDYAGGGIAEVVYREMFQSLGEVVKPHVIMGEGVESRYFVDSHVIGVGKVPQPFSHQERGKSRIIPSELQQIDKGQNFKVFTQPAVLARSDKRIKDKPFSPMLEGCKHHGKPLKPFKSEHIETAVEDLKHLILAECKPQRKVGLLSVDEAVGGFEGKPGYEHLEFSTSEGFPFVSMRPSGESNKRWLFNFNEDNKYINCKDLLKSCLDFKWQQRLDNTVPNTVFTDCLKDCTIEHSKVLEPGKTRIFSMCPVDFSIHQRQCTLDFTVAYMANRRKLEHMIGCNPDSMEWTWLAQDLLSKGSAIATGDYSKYGDSLPFEFILAAFEIISDWYKFNGCLDKELHQQLKIFPYEIGHSLHLMIDHIYQCVCGQPSGNALTVIINSLANSLYIRCAWLTIMELTAYCSLLNMHEEIQIFSYGDDLIISLSDKVKDLFNAKSLCDFFAEYGLKFTNADKSGDILPYGDLQTAEFLKRGFKPHPKRKFPQVILAPLKVESIEDTPNWVWNESFGRSDPLCPTYRDMSMQVCADSVRNAFGRGPEYFKQWASKIRNFWLEQNAFIKLETWESMDVKIFDLNLDIFPYHKWTGVYPIQAKISQKGG